MKTTLTKDDPAGWYLCEKTSNNRETVIHWDGIEMRHISWSHVVRPYMNFRRLILEDEVFALNEQLTERQKELAALKAYSYPMRKADAPDCVGLWVDNCEEVFWVDDLEEFDDSFPPYYYLGPIPVIPAEQKPPQVVTVRHKKSGEVCRAIPSPCGSSLAVLNDDGSFRGNEMVINWEVVK